MRSIPRLIFASSNLVYIAIFICIELCLTLDAASQFYMADGEASTGRVLLQVAGAFGFIAGLLGYYTVAHYLCQDVLPFPVPMGDTSRFFLRRQKSDASRV